MSWCKLRRDQSQFLRASTKVRSCGDAEWGLEFTHTHSFRVPQQSGSFYDAQLRKQQVKVVIPHISIFLPMTLKTESLGYKSIY